MTLDTQMPAADRRRLHISALPLVVALFAILALLAPFGAAEEPLQRVGVLLAVGGGLQVLHGIRRAELAALRRAVVGGVISMLMGLLVLAASRSSVRALVVLLAVTFAVDGLGYVSAAPFGGRPPHCWRGCGGGRLGRGRRAGVVPRCRRRVDRCGRRGAAPARHRVGDGGDARARRRGRGRHGHRRSGPRRSPGSERAAARVTFEEKVRASSDRRWTIAFLVTLFAIHSARLETDGTLLGYAAPAIAVVGDAVLALLFAFVVVVPLAVSLRTSTRWLERRVWRWYLAGWHRRRGLTRRVAPSGCGIACGWRCGCARRASRFPPRSGAAWRAGVPIAAIVAATVPVWGMSWFFDTENWASGIWNSWAEARTDTWREAMVRAVPHRRRGNRRLRRDRSGRQAGDFSFIVIGDTGEGDASQHALRDQLLTVAEREDVRFVSISSDVVYPNGSMIDYETKFWLPFKGVTKPVFAIPGNHDWYDALEAFLATFLSRTPRARPCAPGGSGSAS